MAFNLPVQNFYSKVTSPSDWVRPADWPTITDTVNEVQFLMSDIGDASCSLRTQFTRTSGTQNMIIDWGDGTTTTITSTSVTITNKVYTPGTGTPCSRGYTTFVIRVYFTGSGVTVMNVCQIQALLITGNINTNQVVGVLEAYYGDTTVPTNVPSFNSGVGGASVGYYSYIEYVKLPATVSWSNMTSMFFACSVYKIVMPTSAASLGSMSSTFNACYNLLEVILPSNATGITNLSQTFTSCSKLKKVTFPNSLNSCTNMQSAFNGCSSIENLTLPSVNSVTSFNGCFANMTQLAWVKFNSLPTVASTIDFSSAFQTCISLQNVYFPATATATSTYSFTSTFTSSSQLKSIVFPSNMNASGFSSAFSGCTLLVSCVLPNSMPSCTNLSATFQGCNWLKKFNLPSTLGTGVALNSMFSGCYELEEVTIPNTLTIGNMQGMFGNCYNLKTVNWTPGAQNSLTTLSGTFSNCYRLTSINLPTSMNALTLLTSTFSTCRSLTSITFPSTLNAVTSVSGLMSACVNLVSVTLPTSMTACTNFNSIFASCFSIETITLPTTVSASTTTFNGTFASCYSLKTVTLPSAAQLSLVSDMTQMFYGCQNLTTINNFNKIGSLTATPLLNASFLTYNRFTSISFSAPLSILQLNAGSTTARTDVQTVRLLNTSAGQWTGASPQINVSYTNMSTANLVQLFNDMAAQGTVTSKTINITGATGAAGLTAANRLIVTSKGWTILG